LVIYDSRFGNTERIATQVAESIAGVLGERGSLRLISVDDADTSELAGVDLLVMGGPTQKHRMSPAVRAFLKSIPRRALGAVAAATFDTRYNTTAWVSGSAAKDIASRLRRLGVRRLAPPKSFFVVEREGPLEDGELERATEWAKAVFRDFEALRG
jgi:flavodoxin